VDSQSSLALRPRAIFDNEKALQQVSGGSVRAERSQKVDKSVVQGETIGDSDGLVVSPLHNSVEHDEGEYGSHKAYTDEAGGGDEADEEDENEEDEDVDEKTKLIRRE